MGKKTGGCSLVRGCPGWGGGGSGDVSGMLCLWCLLKHQSSADKNKIAFMNLGFREEIGLEI